MAWTGIKQKFGGYTATEFNNYASIGDNSYSSANFDLSTGDIISVPSGTVATIGDDVINFQIDNRGNSYVSLWYNGTRLTYVYLASTITQLRIAFAVNTDISGNSWIGLRDSNGGHIIYKFRSDITAHLQSYTKDPFSPHILYGDTNGIGRDLNRIWYGDENGVARWVKKVMYGDANGVARLCYEDTDPPKPSPYLELAKIIWNPTEFFTINGITELQRVYDNTTTSIFPAYNWAQLENGGEVLNLFIDTGGTTYQFFKGTPSNYQVVTNSTSVSDAYAFKSGANPTWYNPSQIRQYAYSTSHKGYTIPIESFSVNFSNARNEIKRVFGIADNVEACLMVMRGRIMRAKVYVGDTIATSELVYDPTNN